MQKQQDTVTVLVVDDDPRVRRLERHTLEREGYRVTEVESGSAAVEMVAGREPGLVLLDLSMARMDGFAACQRIREFSLVPIIVVTGKTDEEDRVKGLELGADDYVTKPFFPRELAARVRAVLRRSAVRREERPEESTFRSGDLCVELAKSRVTLAGKEVVLSGTEYRLLAYLARNTGRILTPDQILQQVWGEEYLGEAHLLRVTMARLRQKLGDDPRAPRYITTRAGIGYGILPGTQAAPPAV